MIATTSPQLVASRKAVSAKRAVKERVPSYFHNGAIQQMNKYDPVITTEAKGSPMSDVVDNFGQTIIEGSPKVAEIVFNDTASYQSASADQQPTLASDQTTRVIPQDSEQLITVQGDPDTITEEPQSVAADDEALQEVSGEAENDQEAVGTEEVSFRDVQLSSEQKTKIAAQLKKVLDGSINAKREMIGDYSLFADAWFEANEYGHRNRGDQSALINEMQLYLNTELPNMLKMRSGHVTKGWRINLWSAAVGCAGLLPYGKPVVGAVARLRTKQIISEKFAIAKIKTDKATKKAEKKAKKASKAKKGSKDEKKEQVKQATIAMADVAVTEAVNTATDIPKEAASDAMNELAQDAAQSALGEGLSEFLSDLSSEMFFGSLAELIHFLPIIGQVWSAIKGYSKTSKQCKQDIQDAAKTALREHGRTIIPETIHHIKQELNKLGPRSDIKINRLPACAACFLGQPNRPRDKSCEYCVTAHTDSSSTSGLARKFRHCRDGHDKRIPKEKAGLLKSLFQSKAFAPEHSHHKAWCTKALLAKSKDHDAWDCIPCFLKYGKHKSGKCVLKYKKDCTYCGVKGHHSGACGARFFHAVNLTQQHQEAGIDRQVRNGILDVQHKRFEWIPIGKQKQLWSKINSHVVVVGDKFGSKELYEVSCPRGTDFGRLASLMR